MQGGQLTPAAAQLCVGTATAIAGSTTPAKPGPEQPLPCESKRIIRVNIHFMLKNNGTGNFNETDDGGSTGLLSYSIATSGAPPVAPSTYWNGYRIAEEIVNMANLRNNTNYQMALPAGNATPVLPKKLNYVLTGTYFHRCDSLYKYESQQVGRNPDGAISRSHFRQLGINKASEINIFVLGQDNEIKPSEKHYAGLSGAASGLGFSSAVAGSIDGSNNIWIKMGNLWRVHILARNNGGVSANGGGWPWPLDQTGKMLNHEIGHLLHLPHPYPDGDPCADTPYATGPTDNNTMNSGADCIALTPCQIDIMQAELTNYYGAYTTCGACLPPKAFFTLPSQQVICASMPNVPVDGRGSFNEASYEYKLTPVDGNNQPIGLTTTTSGSGPAGQTTINMSSPFYRNALTLTVTNSCGSHSTTQYVTNLCENPGGGPGARTGAIYPNPVSGGFTLTSEADERALPTVRDRQGRPVAVERTGSRYENGQWHVSYRLRDPAPAGLYLLETGRGAQRQVRSFSLQ